MFRIRIKCRLYYKDCPELGLPAIDWRRAHGLEDRSTNLATSKYTRGKFSDELLCRAAASHLDKQADLDLSGVASLNFEAVQVLLALPETITPEVLTPTVGHALLELATACWQEDNEHD